MHRLLPTALLLLCCTSAMLASARSEHRCLQGNLSLHEGRQLPYSVVVELPRRGQGNWQAYTATASNAWEPIRFHVSKEDLRNKDHYCHADGNNINSQRTDFLTGASVNCEDEMFTAEKREILVAHTLPAAIQLHAERLSVQRATGRMKIPSFEHDSPCQRFTVPESHRQEGVEADFALYVAAAPGSSFSKMCSVEANTVRPTSGVLNVAPSLLDKSRYSIRRVAHEIAHAIGFNVATFERLSMLNALNPKSDFKVYGLESEAVVRAAKLHYNCQTLTSVRLEDAQRKNVKRSHWERLYAKDDLMADDFGPSGGFYSSLTLAAFDAMGFYKADMNKAEPMRWGKDAGCLFLDEKQKCMTNGISPYPEMFCNTTTTTEGQCTFDRLALGNCPIIKRKDRRLSSAHQYFSDKDLVADQAKLMGECPAITAGDYGSCLDGAEEVLVGSLVGPTSRCLTAKGLTIPNREKYERPIGDICARVKCESDNTVSIQYKGDSAWHKCTDGKQLVPSASSAFTPDVGHIVCPKYEEVCTHVIPDSDTDKNIPGGTGQDGKGEGGAETETPTNTPTGTASGTPTGTASGTPGGVPASGFPSSGPATKGEAVEPAVSHNVAERDTTGSGPLPAGSLGANRVDGTSALMASLTLATIIAAAIVVS